VLVIGRAVERTLGFDCRRLGMAALLVRVAMPAAASAEAAPVVLGLVSVASVPVSGVVVGVSSFSPSRSECLSAVPKAVACIFEKV
jgi:hypothetical protein